MRNRSFEVHSSIGGVIVALVYISGLPLWSYAVLSGIAVGVIIEVIQKIFPKLGQFDVNDMIYTAIGSVLTGIIIQNISGIFT